MPKFNFNLKSFSDKIKTHKDSSNISIEKIFADVTQYTIKLDIITSYRNANRSIVEVLMCYLADDLAMYPITNITDIDLILTVTNEGFGNHKYDLGITWISCSAIIKRYITFAFSDGKIKNKNDRIFARNICRFIKF